MIQWRLIDSGFCQPGFNMSLDKALFEDFLSGKSVPTLRLYRWAKPAISLGCFQNPNKVLNLEKCRKDRLEIVKRITGGFGLYHSPRELTYSLVLPADFTGNHSVKDSYQKITHFLIQAYRRLGLAACYAKDYFKSASSQKLKASFCFAQWQEYDILIKNRKIGGNAQKRKKGGIFQHGSIPFELPNNIEKYFLETENIQNKYTSLSELGVVNFHRFKEILIDSFKSSFGVELISEEMNQKSLI